MKRFLRFWLEVFRDFSRHRCSLVAAALSYYVLLSVVPLTMLIVALLGHVLGSHHQALERTLGYLREAVPAGQARELLQEVVEKIIAGRAAATKIGLVALLWVGSQLFMTLQSALNVVWNVETPRNWVFRRLVSLAATVSLGFLALLSVGVNAASAALHKAGDRVLGTLSRPWLWQTGAAVTAVVLLFLVFLLVYRWLPSTEIRWREALLAAALATALWLAAKQGFAWYIADVASDNINQFYGSLGGVIIVLLWGFYSSLVILFSAEVAANFGRVYLHQTKSLTPETGPQSTVDPVSRQPGDA